MSEPAAAPLGPRRIWLCADDYGISPAVSTAIRHLIVHRRLNATSVMVVAPSFDRSEAQALTMINAPRAAIGLHLTLTAPFRPASPRYRPKTWRGTFLSLGRTMAAAFLGRLRPAELSAEIAAQFDAFHAAFDRPPDFVDGHQHVHLLPQVSEAVLSVVKEVAPQAWVRQCGRPVPGHGGLSDRKAALLDRLSSRFRERATAFGVRTNPAFAGAYHFHRRTVFADIFPHFLDQLPDGGLVMCHPGFVDDELERLDPLTKLREQEYAYFAGEAFPALLSARGVELAPPPA
jgi:predicted glycoside hydrolase/deacetylase ChbG (UPF0249 family)